MFNRVTLCTKFCFKKFQLTEIPKNRVRLDQIYEISSVKFFVLPAQPTMRSY